jgi:hypothetical protein
MEGQDGWNAGHLLIRLYDREDRVIKDRSLKNRVLQVVCVLTMAGVLSLDTCGNRNQLCQNHSQSWVRYLSDLAEGELVEINLLQQLPHFLRILFWHSDLLNRKGKITLVSLKEKLLLR